MGIYFDNNATTPIDPEVREAMLPFLEDTFGNPSSIHLFGQAARRALDRAREQAAARLDEDMRLIRRLRDRLETGILAGVPGATRMGGAAHRLAGTSCIGFPGVEGDTLVMALDLRGVAISTGAACESDSKTPSRVLRAMGVPAELAKGVVRFSLGRLDTAAEVDEVVETVRAAVANLAENG